MSRVLVLGTSHAAAIRRALDAISQRFRDLSVTCWTLTARGFAMASVDAAGILRPDPSNAKGLMAARRWNGAACIDLAPFDLVLLVGLDMGQARIRHLLLDLQPLEWGRRDGAIGVSLNYLRATVRAVIDATLAAQAARLPFDLRFIAMPPPYASASIIPATHREIAALAALPQADVLMGLYEAEMAAAHQARGLAFLPQPRQTLAQPWLTQDHYRDTGVDDKMHMNAEFGLLVFEAMVGHAAFSMPDPAPANS